MRPLWSMSMQVGLVKSGSDAQSLNTRPSTTLNVFSAFSGGSCARAGKTRAHHRLKVRNSVWDLMRVKLSEWTGRDTAGAWGQTELQYSGRKKGGSSDFRLATERC